MVNKYFSLVLFIFFLSVVSCKEVSTNKNIKREILSEAIKIDLSKFKELAKTDNPLIKKFDIIQLETNEKNLIGFINKILITGENILILDKKRSKSVFNFNYSGEYLGKIGSDGNGPQEYSFIEDMDLDANENIHILDLRKTKILKFKMSGDYISEKKFSFKTHKFSVLDNNSYIFDQGTRNNFHYKNNVDLDYKLIAWNPNSQTLNKFIKYNTTKYDQPGYPLPSNYSIYRSGRKLNYLKPYEYNIFKIISDKEVVAKYNINFGKYNVPESFYPDLDKAKNSPLAIMNTNYAHTLMNVFETSSYLCFNFFFKKKIYWAAVSKINNSIIIRDTSKMKLEEYPFLLFPTAVFNNQLITVLHYGTIQHYIKKFGKKEMIKAGFSILTEHKPDMNPIVVMWNLKDYSI